MMTGKTVIFPVLVSLICVNLENCCENKAKIAYSNPSLFAYLTGLFDKINCTLYLYFKISIGIDDDLVSQRI